MAVVSAHEEMLYYKSRIDEQENALAQCSCTGAGAEHILELPVGMTVSFQDKEAGNAILVTSIRSSTFRKGDEILGIREAKTATEATTGPYQCPPQWTDVRNNFGELKKAYNAIGTKKPMLLRLWRKSATPPVTPTATRSMVTRSAAATPSDNTRSASVAKKARLIAMQ